MRVARELEGIASAEDGVRIGIDYDCAHAEVGWSGRREAGEGESVEEIGFVVVGSDCGCLLFCHFGYVTFDDSNISNFN